MYARAPTCMYVYFELCDGHVDWDVFACAYIHIHACICIYTHVYTGLCDGLHDGDAHTRLGADSPVLLLDRDIAASIAQIIIADKW